MSEKTPIELSEEAKKPGKFNIIDVVKDRAFPEEVVHVYVNDDVAYKASQVKDLMEKTDPEDERYAKLQAQFDSLIAEMDLSKYTFTVKGISEGKRDELYKVATEKYPLEYNETKNVYTGEISREEIESEERDSLLTSLLWSAHITKIEAPNGDVQDFISPEDAMELRSSLPIASNALINKSIEKIRAATAMFMISVDEDFLAKS